MAMATVFNPPPPPLLHRNCRVAISLSSLPAASSSLFLITTPLLQTRARAQRTESKISRIEFRTRSRVKARKKVAEISEEEEEESDESVRDFEDGGDWEDQILQETAPLAGFARMILHSNRYDVGDKLIPEHEKVILERLLPYHPEFEKKIGSGIHCITVGFHPDFEGSKCLFIVRKDGELVDFSYWKCLKGLIKKNYPMYADSFILKHFRKRQKG